MPAPGQLDLTALEDKLGQLSKHELTELEKRGQLELTALEDELGQLGKKIRNLQKKLRQIDNLKANSGTSQDQLASIKVQSEQQLKTSLQECLQLHRHWEQQIKITTIWMCKRDRLTGGEEC